MKWFELGKNKRKGKKVKVGKSKSENITGVREEKHLLSRDKMKVGEIES